MVSFKLGLGGGLVIAAAAIAFIFKDKISDFFSNISGGVEGAKEIGETVSILNENLQGNLTGLQDILTGFKNFEFPKFEFPTFDFSNLFPGSTTQQTQDTDLFSGINDLFSGLGDLLGGILNPDPEEIIIQGEGSPGGGLGFNDSVTVEVIKAIQQPIDPIRTVIETPQSIFVPAGDELNLGGGPSFMGGTTTFGDNLVDTLTEVLNIFPDLTASQARDALEENPDLTASQFRLINPDVINISNAEIENQVFLNSSGDFTGLTPTQIAQLLTGGNINNF